MNDFKWWWRHHIIVKLKDFDKRYTFTSTRTVVTYWRTRILRCTKLQFQMAISPFSVYLLYFYRNLFSTYQKMTVFLTFTCYLVFIYQNHCVVCYTKIFFSNFITRPSDSTFWYHVIPTWWQGLEKDPKKLEGRVSAYHL